MQAPAARAQAGPSAVVSLEASAEVATARHERQRRLTVDAAPTRRAFRLSVRAPPGDPGFAPGQSLPASALHAAVERSRIMDLTALRAHAHQILRDATIPELPHHYSGKVAGQLRPAGWAADHHRDRSIERVRPDPVRRAVQGAGADADRPVLVRGDAGYLPQPRADLSRPKRRHRRAAGYFAGGNRGAGLPGWHHGHVDPDAIQGRGADDVWRDPAGWDARQSAATAPDHHAHQQGVRWRA